MAEHSIEFEVDSDIQDEDFLRPEVVYEQDITDSDDSNSLTQLGPLVEYIYDENQVQMNEEDYLNTEEDIDDVYFKNEITEDVEIEETIQPMMPFCLSSPVTITMDENDEVGETIILEIENEPEETVPLKKPQPPRYPIPDEVRASTLQLLLCASKTNLIIDTFTCEICWASYGCLNCLKSHYETMHLGNTVISRYKCKYSTNISKGLYCPVCELTFETRNDTMDHYITHAVACDICGSGFDRQMYLTEHLRTAHSKGSFDVMYDCELCKITYQYGNSLSKHYQNFHKIILCVDCNLKFDNVTDLHEHEDTHRLKIDVLPYACSKCDKAFAQISDIAVHIRQDHNHKRKLEQFETVYVLSSMKNKKPLKGNKKKLK